MDKKGYLLNSNADPPVSSPTRFNNHGVASLPLLSIPCSLLSLTACSTASCTLSPVFEGGGGTARSVASGLGKVKPVSDTSARMCDGRTYQLGRGRRVVYSPWSLFFSLKSCLEYSATHHGSRRGRVESWELLLTVRSHAYSLRL